MKIESEIFKKRAFFHYLYRAMFTGTLRYFYFVGILSFTSLASYSQTNRTFVKSQKNEDCTKGAAGIQINGLQSTDTLTLEWNTGVLNVQSISEISAGDYWVNVKIKHVIDTTINFTIEKEECKVVISNQFTPNGDNYNDHWQISNTIYYPKFELYVFNKWGQQVHHQQSTYTPWDGRWNGINAPDGTYYYVFYYDGGDKSKLIKGDVTLLR